MNRLVHPLSNSPWSMVRMPLTQYESHSSRHQDTFFIENITFTVLTTHLKHITLPFFTQNISSSFYGLVLIIEITDLVFMVFFNEVLAPGGWKGNQYSASSWHNQSPKKWLTYTKTCIFLLSSNSIGFLCFLFMFLLKLLKHKFIVFYSCPRGITYCNHDSFSYY